MATSATTAPASGHHAAPVSFDTSLRGYERSQVDAFVAEKSKEVARLQSDLSEATTARKRATEHAEATEVELRELRAKSAHVEPVSVEDSFGYRAEKLLRMAEHEAAEARSHASRESAAIVEHARTDAEKHRHEVEQSLIARASMLDAQAAQRTAELQDREQHIAEQLAAAREQAEQLHSAAARAADRLRQESEAAAQETRLRAETLARRERDQAAHEIARLTGLQSDVRAELARLSEVLTAELAGSTTPSRRRGSEQQENGHQDQRPQQRQAG